MTGTAKVPVTFVRRGGAARQDRAPAPRRRRRSRIATSKHALVYELYGLTDDEIAIVEG